MNNKKIKTIGIPSCYRDFKCIDVACTDTCCAGWQVDVDETSWEYYKSVEGEFGAFLHSVMVEGAGLDDTDAGQFQLCSNGDCPFLMESGLCKMFGELGEESLCDTCTNFPRYAEDYGALREVGIAFSCPEAARLMLSNNKPMEFEELPVSDEKNAWDDAVKDIMWRMQKSDTEGLKVTKIESVGFDTQVDEGLDILDEHQTSTIAYMEQTEEFDEEYFAVFYEARKIAMKLVQNRELSVKERVILYLDYTTILQNTLDSYDEVDEDCLDELAEIRESYSDTNWLKKRLVSLKQSFENLDADADAFSLYDEPVPFGECQYTFLPEYAAVIFQELKHCKKEWGPMLEDAEEVLHKQMSVDQYKENYKAFANQYQDKEYVYEHLLSYYVFRYFCKAYFDDDIYGKGRMAVMAYLMIRELAVCQWVKQNKTFSDTDQEWLFHMYSRELEHSEENYDTYIDLLRMESMCNYEHLMAVLLED